MSFPEPTQQPPASQLVTSGAYRRRLRIAQGVLLLFHVTGFLGLAFSQDPSFYLQFVPLNLLLTMLLLLAFQVDRSAAFIVFCITVAAVSFFVEVAGVQTGRLFGQYEYGNVLGWKWMSVPLLIGLNWLMLTYMAGVLSCYLRVPGFVRALAAAVLVVGMDICIEPVAVHYNFWTWQYDVIPMQNFKAWFALALILQVYFNRTYFVKRNPLVPFVYLLQLLFFFGLGLLK
ncbi:MAG TPA: carotenoid biosynthesis protein [Hymenobacter sp.]|jgi:putative membrane protein